MSNSTSTYLSPWFMQGGRLGNVMFTLAAAYVHSLKVGRELRVPWHQCEASKMLGEVLGYPFKDTAGKKNEPATYKEKEFRYSPIPTTVTQGALMGYFQSWKYLEGYEDKVRELFEPLCVSRKDNIASTAVHIRLGDYRHQGHTFRTADPDFIERCIPQLHPGIIELRIFSDEQELAKRVLESVPGVRGKYRITVSDSKNPIHALWHMTSHDSLIMSCSSFSWWAAFLAQPSQVFVPSEWFMSGEDDYSDVCPEHWIKL